MYAGVTFTTLWDEPTAYQGGHVEWLLNHAAKTFLCLPGGDVQEAVVYAGINSEESDEGSIVLIWERASVWRSWLAENGFAYTAIKPDVKKPSAEWLQPR